MDKIIQTLSDPANYINGLIGAMLGFLVAPSSVKGFINLIKWYKSKRHWIVGTWHLYYFNFNELKPEFFTEKWMIKRP